MSTGESIDQRIRRREEEELTPYLPSDVAEDWEFKILRSLPGVFKNPEKLRAILDEERRAGWVLVEKFDDHRIRLKRPGSVRQLDGKLDFDAYRTTIGPSENAYLARILGSVILVMAVMVAIIISLSITLVR